MKIFVIGSIALDLIVAVSSLFGFDRFLAELPEDLYIWNNLTATLVTLLNNLALSGAIPSIVFSLIVVVLMLIPRPLWQSITAGVIVSALGAVMDVAMSISSAIRELTRVNDSLNAKDLFKSGMNIGRDMVGTMTNTLILAILGSGLTLVVYIYSLGLQPWQLLSSAYMSLEAISGVASSIGVMLAVPLTAAICAFTFGKK